MPIIRGMESIITSMGRCASVPTLHTPVLRSYNKEESFQKGEEWEDKAERGDLKGDISDVSLLITKFKKSNILMENYFIGKETDLMPDSRYKPQRTNSPN